MTSPCPKQVNTLQSAQGNDNRADLQAQIVQLAAGTIDLAEGQAISAASLVKAHEKTNVLAAALQKQQECMKVCIQPFLTTAVSFCVHTDHAEGQQQWRPQVLRIRMQMMRALHNAPAMSQAGDSR